MSENMKLWSAVCITDPSAVKSITGKQYKGNNTGHVLKQNNPSRTSGLFYVKNPMSTSQKPLNYDPTDPDKMALPVGSTCGDCMHINKCKAMYGHTETDTSCDWSPSKFNPAKQPPTDGNWYWVKYEGLGKTYTAPAMYRADAKAFYSVEFSGVPEKEVVVLRKA